MTDTDERMVAVWDPFVRLFHWSLVAAIATAWLAEEGETVHRYAGYTAGGLVAARIAWGFIGTRHARFGDFLASPPAALRYLRDEALGRGKRYLGHNPAGAVMIAALIALVAGTGFTGWLSTTDAYFGVDWVGGLHAVLANTMLACIGLHVAGVVFASLRHRENLVRAMITGRKRTDQVPQ
ncbi:cytochrome b/b6 domain-containing protein [Zavarzinia compransoris]|uniref:Cytochrome B n=1 Tax=Zavarzinia compransoris TaxID=1264899 RepID=A0A317DWZ7_9PROT|nr:cytochrome b/b6 domain-containing protein [Zavarzinia compransoris]PWR18884.1 cytochrome B [Zavarzinia compransoris]TDP48879.1 cytochrome b [Zavarzinia compransoris]